MSDDTTQHVPERDTPDTGQNCTICGRVVDADDCFCRNCGHPFDILPAPVAAPQASSHLSRTIPLPPQYSQPAQRPYGNGPVVERPLPERQRPASGGRMIQLPAGKHSTGTAILLAVLLTGAGQMANKQVAKGLVLLLTSILVNFFIPFGGAVVWVIALIDAIHVATRLNRGEPVGDWQFF